MSDASLTSIQSIVCCSINLETHLPKRSSRARTVWALQHRLNRLIVKAEKAKGTTINLVWYEYADAIFATIDQLESLGVDFSEASGV